MTGDCAVYDDGVLRITNTDDPPGLVIAGEIDESTYPGLVGALDRFTDGPAEIHLSLGGVSYCDLAGLRAIVGVTGGSDSGGRPRNGFGHSKRVVLHEVPPQLRNVLQIVGWDSTPGLALDRPDASTLPGQAGNLPGQAGPSGSDRQGSAVW
jgi:ABC-type transporter Mla MlaB component